MESIIQYDIILGEDLSDTECLFKAVEGIVSLTTFGLGVAGKGAGSILAAYISQAGGDLAAEGIITVGEAIDLPPLVTALLALAGGSYAGGKLNKSEFAERLRNLRKSNVGNEIEYDEILSLTNKGGSGALDGTSNIITNKFPDEALPLNGKIIDYYIEDGKIKGINGLNEVDFVITKNGELIIGNKHHYLGQGQDVMAAGQLKINGQGQIKRIDNLSGHYRPTVQEAMSYKDLFKKLNLSTDKTWLQYYRIEADDLGFITQDPILEYSKMLKE